MDDAIGEGVTDPCAPDRTRKRWGTRDAQRIQASREGVAEGVGGPTGNRTQMLGLEDRCSVH